MDKTIYVAVGHHSDAVHTAAKHLKDSEEPRDVLVTADSMQGVAESTHQPNHAGHLIPIKLSAKPHETMENAFYRQLANRIQNIGDQDCAQKNDGAAEADYIWPGVATYRHLLDTHRQSLVDLGLAPACFRHTEQGWVAIYSPRHGMPWFIPLLNRAEELDELNRDPKARGSGPIPDPSSSTLTEENLPYKHLLDDTMKSVKSDPPFEERQEIRIDYIHPDATPAILASVLTSSDYHAEPGRSSVAVRRRDLPLLLCTHVDWNDPPKEVTIRTIYRWPEMLVGVNEASKTQGVAWVTGYIALRKNPSPEALEKFRHSQRRAINPGAPMQTELPSPFGCLLVFQKLTFPTGTGLEPQRLVQTVREFERYMVDLTLMAADYNLLQGQEQANFSVSIETKNKDQSLPES